MNNIRDNGLHDRESAIEKIGVHDHLCLIYETQEEQFSAVIPFMKIGLNRGEKCIYIVDDNTAATVINKMKESGIAVEAAIDSGKLAVINKQDAYLKEGYFDPDLMIGFLKQATDEAKAAGFSALRVTGEMTWMLGGDPGTERLMEYEAKLNYFFPYNDALAICQYNHNRFSPEIIKGVISTHPLVICGGVICRNFYYVPPDDFLGEKQPAKEIGRLLANILNREKAEEELRQYQEHLEELVEERTAELKRMNERFSLATHAARLGVWDWDLQKNELVWDDGVYALFGVKRGDVANAYKAWLQGVHPDDKTPNDEMGRLARLGEREYDIEFRVVWPDESIHYLKAYGLVVRDSEGQPLRMTGINFDITESKQAEDKIRNLAFYDTLTKLPNRRLLLDRLELAIMASERSKHFGAVLFLDMDKFKVLNDLLGHFSGDLMLIQVAERIRGNIREVDTAARFGGDEFVVLFEDLGNSEEEASQRVALIAEKIRAALAEPYHIKEHVHHSSPSIGVCLYCGHEISVQDLIKHADIAMYQAKNGGRNKVCFYDPISQQAVKMRAALESDLRRALSDHQLHMYYQIQFDNNGLPRGAEALIRWIHPERGMILPKQFIPIAEESSLILEIGRWVLESACQQLAEWNKNEVTRNLLLAVNVSAHQFMMHNFVELIDELVRAYRIDASRLRLELTESAMLNDIPDSISKMKALKALGIKLSLDDFGTGYSSLAYLKRLPIDQIKIDRSFMRDVASDPNDAMMVKAIIDMAKNFSMNVIAEGVETEEQLAFLKNNGCMTFQGYLFGKPMPIEQVDMKLKSRLEEYHEIG